MSPPVPKPPDSPPHEGPPAETPEQVAGRPLVDLTVDELRAVAADFEVEGRSSMKRDELIVALGGDPEASTDAERVADAAAAVAAENAVALPEDDDPLALPPWERHDDVEQPLTAEQVVDAALAAQGLELVHTRDGGMVRTWADAEAVAESGDSAPVDEPS